MAKASEASRSLSGILIGAALSLIAGSLFVAGSFLDKSNLSGMMWGSIWVGIAIAFFLASIIAGGRGMTRDVRTGIKGHFNVQATCGLFGIIFLAIAAAVFVFSPK